MTEAPTAETVLTYSAGALVAAGALLVLFVLPAEYGIDPVGSGRLLGLEGLAGAEHHALVESEAPYRTDTADLTLAPFEWLEYKYRLEDGDTLVFAWRASAPLDFDLHAERDKADGRAESFARGRAAGGQGSYRAAYGGIHGWYFQNRGTEPVTLTLSTAGFYGFAKLYRDDVETARPLTEVF